MKINTKEKFLEKCKEIWSDKYTYDKLIYKFSNQKGIITCKIHGDFTRKLTDLYQRKRGCSKCHKRFRHNTESFIEMAKEKYGNKFDYSKFIYINAKTKGIIICPHHGEISYSPNRHMMSMHGCPTCGHTLAGNKRFSNLEEWKETCKKIHGDKYNYSKSIYTYNTELIEIICPKHGNFFQKADSHKRGFGCEKCRCEFIGNVHKLTADKFIKNIKKIYGEVFNYDKTIFTSYTDVDLYCLIHGYFKATVSNLMQNKKGCLKCNGVLSVGEDKISKCLNKWYIQYISQKTFVDCINPITNHKLRYDFYLPDFNLCIEFDGILHFKAFEGRGGEKKLLLSKEKDNIKNKYCEDNNIELLRIHYIDTKNIESILKNKLIYNA